MAEVTYKQALELFKEDENLIGEASVLDNLAELYSDQPKKCL